MLPQLGLVSTAPFHDLYLREKIIDIAPRLARWGDNGDLAGLGVCRRQARRPASGLAIPLPPGGPHPVCGIARKMARKQNGPRLVPPRISARDRALCQGRTYPG